MHPVRWKKQGSWIEGQSAARLVRNSIAEASAHIGRGNFPRAKYGLTPATRDTEPAFACGMNFQTPSRVALVVCAWLVAAGIGSAMLLRYENAPGPERGAPGHWPAESRIAHGGGMPTLLIFIHPECPCSRASLGELARLLAQCPGRARACVLMLDVDGLPQDAADTPLWRDAEAIPGVTVLRDTGGAEARAFRGATSGRTLLYGASGGLLFAGGITASRGHAGDNAGRSSLRALLRGEVPEQTATPVFGCPLFTPCPTTNFAQP